MNRILLVNDSRFESLIMKDILDTMGYYVKVSDEYDAMNLVQTFKPDLFIANYIMKEIKGDELISRVKMQSPDIKCLLCSSSASLAQVTRNKSIDGFISTPVEKPVLEKVLAGMNIGDRSQHEMIDKNGMNNESGKEHFCGHCGQEVNKTGEKQFAFCPYCGHKL